MFPRRSTVLVVGWSESGILLSRRAARQTGRGGRPSPLAATGPPKDKVETIALAGILHDIGKVSVPTDILNRPGQLGKMEMTLIREHSRLGYDIVQTLDLPWAVGPILRRHYERLDGSGYPEGLAGENIAFEAAILAVADVVEAMMSHRPYRVGLGLEMALQEIVEKKGVLYDPKVVEACLRLFREKGFRIEDKPEPPRGSR